MRIKPQRLKKRHNLKGRVQHHESKPANNQAAHIRIDPSIFGGSEYDTSTAASSNQLILPSSKTTVKRKTPVEVAEKRLSKRQRKALEKIVLQKKKKEQRSSVLEDLQKFRVDADHLDKLVPVVALTRGSVPKKSRYETDVSDRHSSKSAKIHPLAGCKKKGATMLSEGLPVEKMNLVESSSSDESEVEIVAETECSKQPEQEVLSEQVKNEPTEVRDAEVDECPFSEDVATIETALALVPTPANPTTTPNDGEIFEPKPVKKRKLKFTLVYRTKEMQEGRLKLPILSEEHVIMEAISDNPVVIICGETGSGKTTQVPQFLYEAGYGEFGTIGVTEPRRVAAVAMSRRVAEEMSLTESGQVSFVIRYEGTASSDTKIKFMTDGVLLKEVENDFLLSMYSVIVIDEAHERSVFTDILIGLLSRIVRLRAKRGNPLKLVIMSATLRVDDFTANKHLFSEVPPVIKIESRQFPVTVHFSRETPSDYMSEAYHKVCKIHREQPAGGVLVFVTGQDEVHWLVSKLKAKFGQDSDKVTEISDSQTKRPANRYHIPKRSCHQKTSDDSGTSLLDSLHVDLDEYSLKSEVEGMDNDEEEGGENHLKSLSDPAVGDSDEGGEDEAEGQYPPMWVLPLYALLPTERQQLVFQPPPNQNARLCVISTNVGETSLTIPNIRYVVDTGKVKTKLYDKVTGVSTFVITLASKASAIQRAGRAGRVGPGHCYRLFSTAVFTDEMQQFAEPEIARRPVDDLVLQMKAISIDRVMNFPFPTPPPDEAITAAETLLIKLGALSLEQPKSDKETSTSAVAKITDLGRLMARLPVSPRFSRILCSAPDRKSLTYLIAMLSGLSVQELLLNDCESGNSEASDKNQCSTAKIRRIRSAWSPPGEGRLLGDAGLFLRAIGAAEYSNATPQFCRTCGIRLKALLEARKVRLQLTNIVNSLHPSVDVTIDPQMSPPGDADCLLLRRLLLTGFGDRVAKKVEDNDVVTDESGNKQQRNSAKPGGSYSVNGLDGVHSIHPSSVLYREPPSYILFQEISETSIGEKAGTTYLKLVSAIEPKWLPTTCPTFCTFGEIAEDELVAGEPVGPRWSESSGTVKCHQKVSYGTQNWNLGLAEVDYPPGVDRIRWFARLFLEGKVICALEQYVPVLLGAPLSVVKSWGRLQPRTEMFVRTLYAKNVDSLATLKEAWQNDSKFLLSSYLEWLPSSLHAQVSAAWPPIVVLPKKNTSTS